MDDNKTEGIGFHTIVEDDAVQRATAGLAISVVICLTKNLLFRGRA